MVLITWDDAGVVRSYSLLKSFPVVFESQQSVGRGRVCGWPFDLKLIGTPDLGIKWVIDVSCVWHRQVPRGQVFGLQPQLPGKLAGQHGGHLNQSEP